LRYNQQTLKETTDAQEREREVIVYDGDCPVCRTLKAVAEHRLDQDTVKFAPFQAADLEQLSPGLTPEMAEQAMYLILKDGRRVGGARAFLSAMRQMEGPWGLLGRLLYPLGPILEPFYKLFARYRHWIAPLFERGNNERE
jgi:predicted DCC family thiol-disulfide oxidoreductase YuxK